MPQEHSDQCKGCGTAADIAADADDLAAIDRFAVEVERNGFPFWHKNNPVLLAVPLPKPMPLPKLPLVVQSTRSTLCSICILTIH